MTFIKDRSSKLILITLSIFVLLVGVAGWVGATEKTHVNGTSMAPTLDNGQSIILNTYAYTYGDVEFGDIVVVHPEGHKQYVKRIVGLPGDTITFKNNQLYRNGAPLNDFHSKEVRSKMGTPDNEGAWDVSLKADEYYVLSDNLHNTVDSRIFNAVDKEDILGKVIIH